MTLVVLGIFRNYKFYWKGVLSFIDKIQPKNTQIMVNQDVS